MHLMEQISNMEKERNNVSLTMDDITIRRDSDGGIVPMTVSVIGSGGSITFRPFTYGLTKSLPTNDVTDWDDQKKVDLLREAMVVPDMSNLDTKKLQDLSKFYIDNILITIVMYSGSLLKVGYTQTDSLNNPEKGGSMNHPEGDEKTTPE